MKKTIISFVVFTLLTFGTALAAPETQALDQSTKICTTGFVDVNKVMTESPRVKEFQDQLNQLGKEMSDQLEAEKANLTTEEFQQKKEAVYGEFMKAKQEMEGRIDENIRQAMEKVAREKNLTIILYKNSVAFGGIDVTTDVINHME